MPSDCYQAVELTNADDAAARAAPNCYIVRPHYCIESRDAVISERADHWIMKF